MQSSYLTARKKFAEGDHEQAHALCMSLLQENPRFSDAYYLLSLIAIAHGNYAKAIDVLDRAIGFDANKPEYFAEKSKCYMALNRHSNAREQIELAAAIPDQSAMTFDTIGVVYSRLGDHRKAIPYFEKAVALDASKADFHYNRGASQQFLGDFLAADSSYEQAIALAPGMFKAHSAVSQLSKQSAQSNHIDRLKACWAKVNDADGRLHIGHSLAKELEDLEEHAASFRYLSKAKSLKQKEINYSIEVDRGIFSAVKRNFETVSIGDGYNNEEPIFIVGMPRTGTTLVERIISSHSQVYSAGELTNFALVAKRLTDSESNFVLDAETIMATGEVDMGDLGRGYIKSTRPRTGHTPRFVDKMPLNFFYVGLITRALPNCRIIVLMRNPMDTCLSNYRQLFSTRFPYYHYALNIEDTARYYLMYRDLIAYWCDSLQAKIHIVDYEGLVQDPESTVKELLGFCGLDFEASCLEFHKNDAPVSTASSVQVRSPIYRNAVARWKKYEPELASIRKIFEQASVRVD